MIALENVRLKFDSRGIAGLSGVSLTLSEGTVTALMGPNGSGKTTLLKVLSGEITPEEGTVKKEDSAYLAQPENVPAELNVMKFLTGKARPEVDEEKRIQLARDLADIFEFTFQLRQKMGELSAGQRQKVFLAGELIRGPRLIMLDEPFTHLDPHTRKDILKALFDYVRRQGLTLLWVTHDLNEATRFSDRLVLLQHGKIEQEGTAEELVLTPKNIFVAQFMGHHNFFPVKRKASGWLTPWGEKAFPKNPEGEEAILVVPDRSWNFGEVSSLKASVQEVFFYETERTLIATLDERAIRIRGVKDPMKAGQTVNLIPCFSECFLIPL